MNYKLGIRREDKNKWERRVPITPEHIKELKQKHNIQSIIQPSSIRIFTDEEYQEAEAIIDENLTYAKVVFAVKEIPIDFFEKQKTYVFFSHTIKGQKYNMPMLQKMMEQGCNLIDYEKITDKYGRRLIFFGRFAGIAGMTDTLWAFGKRIKSKNIDTSLSDIKQTIYYQNLNDMKRQIIQIGKKIRQKGLPKSLSPFIVGLAGYGNVSKGAQEILDLLPIEEIRPSQLQSVFFNPSNKVIYKVIFREEDMVKPCSQDNKFDLQEYYTHPERYQSKFDKYVPKLSILMNCIYWEKKYPRLITKEYLKEQFSNNNFRLEIIGDISSDINGAIECTVKTTNPGNPVFIYNPKNEKVTDGFTGEGIAMISTDNLPCEIPRDSSNSFSKILKPFVPAIVKADYSVEFDKLQLPQEIKKAVILYHGKLTPDYKYIKKFL